MRLVNKEQAAWQRYKALADHPAWFTRWMLQRTQVVLEHCRGASQEVFTEASKGDSVSRDLALCEGALGAVVEALGQSPAEPPSPVDPRVDMLFVVLTNSQAHFVAALFDSADALPTGPLLDATQQKRKNPWGGFREAWLEYCAYNKDGKGRGN